MSNFRLTPEQDYLLSKLESRLGKRTHLFEEMKIVSDLSAFWKFLQNCELRWFQNKKMGGAHPVHLNYGLDLYLLNHEISITLTVLFKVKYGMPDSALHINFVTAQLREGEVSLDPLLFEILEASMEMV